MLHASLTRAQQWELRGASFQRHIEQEQLDNMVSLEARLQARAGLLPYVCTSHDAVHPGQRRAVSSAQEDG